MEDVVLRFHGDMACMSAVRDARRIGRETVGLGVVVEQRVSPPATLRKSLAVLLHEERLGEDVGYIHDERSLCALFWLPLELRDLGAIRESLTVGWNAGL